MNKTNVAFWFLVIAALVALWASLRFFFGRVGEIISRLVGEIKDNIMGENHKNKEDK